MVPSLSSILASLEWSFRVTRLSPLRPPRRTAYLAAAAGRSSTTKARDELASQSIQPWGSQTAQSTLKRCCSG
jgi:hypothetical protein